MRSEFMKTVCMMMMMMINKLVFFFPGSFIQLFDFLLCVRVCVWKLFKKIQEESKQLIQFLSQKKNFVYFKKTLHSVSANGAFIA